VRGSRLRLRGEKGVKENDEGPIVLLSLYPLRERSDRLPLKPRQWLTPPHSLVYWLPKVVVQYQPYFESLL
jgi:hypothetical protein